MSDERATSIQQDLNTTYTLLHEYAQELAERPVMTWWWNIYLDKIEDLREHVYTQLAELQRHGRNADEAHLNALNAYQLALEAEVEQ